MKKTKKEQIVEAAYDLFLANGFYATGVDLIMRTAGVSKRTLYNYFPTKNDLIVAALGHYRKLYKNHLDGLLDTDSKTSREKVLAIFSDAMNWFNDSNFHGCLAANAMGEFSGKDNAIEGSCVQFKCWEIDVLSSLTKDFDDRAPVELAHKLFVLLEGMSSIAHIKKGPFPVDMVAMADEIIDNHLAR